MRRAFNALKNGRSAGHGRVPADVMTAEFAGNQVDYTNRAADPLAGDEQDMTRPPSS